MRGTAAALLTGSAFVIASGCSLIVPSEAEHVRCSVEGAIGPPACGPSQICADGACTGCIKTDACGDGVDNDCNGVVDDGCPDGGPLPVGARCCGSGECGVDAACVQDATQASTCRLSVHGAGAVGDACSTNADCRSGQCLALAPGATACTDACCTDADCGDPSGFACRQQTVGNIIGLRCVPR